ncbi:MAG: hypothetical protein CMI79_06695 [Candidatus Pelagibacter sp.]|nr:hypothetical protein [Candidatus Pelagibacter sp.]
MPDSNFNTNEVTLRFLANNVYQEVMEKKDEKNKPTQEDYKFYKKRLYSLHKQMLKGNYPTDNLKHAHMLYVSELIEYMKVTDRADLLQKDFEKSTTNKNIQYDAGINLSPIAESCTKKADMGIMKQIEGKEGSLDDFVERKTVRMLRPPPPPRKKNLDIKTDEHKVKGLKKKIPESPIKCYVNKNCKKNV